MGILKGLGASPRVGKWVVLTAFVGVMGCASDLKTELAYEAVPTEGLTQVPPVKVNVALFKDYRTEPETVGVISHGLFESAVRPDIKIRVQQGSVATWVSDALEAELELRGYDVVPADDAPEWQIRGGVLELVYREGGWPILTRPSAVLTIECEVMHDGRSVFRERYWNSASTSTRPGDPAKLLEIVLRRNLKKFVEDLEAERKRARDNG